MTSTRHETSFEDNVITRSRPQNILNITQITLKSDLRLDMIPMTSFSSSGKSFRNVLLSLTCLSMTSSRPEIYFDVVFEGSRMTR